MLSPKVRQLVLLAASLDALLLVVSFLLAFGIRQALPLDAFEARTPALEGHVWLLTVGIPLFWLLARAAGVYDVARFRAQRIDLAPLARAFAWTGAVLGTAIFLAQAKGFSRVVFFLFLGFAFALTAAGKIAFQLRVRRNARSVPPVNVMIVGGEDEAQDVRARIEAHPEYGMRVVGTLAEGGERLKRLLEEQPVDEVVFAVRPEEVPALSPQIRWCEEVGVTVHVKADFVRTLVARTYASELDGIPMLTFAPTSRDAGALLVKRGIDLAVSFLALALLSPLLLACALLVKLTSRGPVLFVQKRVGLNGRVFDLYKFRSMAVDAEARLAEVAAANEATGPVFKMRRDPRVTAVGRWLRRFSLDELPQLWNVLRGDMSLVGPRPPIPDEVRRYERWQRRRLSMKPGITCLWQVEGRSRVGFEEWMRLDLAYIDNWSLALDLKILLRTVPAVVLARGAH